MVFTMIPMIAFAGEDQNVCECDGQYYSTVQAAYDAAVDGINEDEVNPFITLYADVDLSEELHVYNLYLDLNGHSFKQPIKTFKSLSIDDTSEDKDGSFNSDLTIGLQQSVNIKNTDAYGVYNVTEKTGRLTISFAYVHGIIANAGTTNISNSNTAVDSVITNTLSLGLKSSSLAGKVTSTGGQVTVNASTLTNEVNLTDTKLTLKGKVLGDNFVFNTGNSVVNDGITIGSKIVANTTIDGFEDYIVTSDDPSDVDVDSDPLNKAKLNAKNIISKEYRKGSSAKVGTLVDKYSKLVDRQKSNTGVALTVLAAKSAIGTQKVVDILETPFRLLDMVKTLVKILIARI
ncbi:MAG: hypothetical protein MJ146_00010 [Clostridia bacterium]|nr:hypothetical protein [Clostridia bacterium]